MSIQRTIGPKVHLSGSTGYSPLNVRNPFMKMHCADLSTTPVISGSGVSASHQSDPSGILSGPVLSSCVAVLSIATLQSVSDFEETDLRLLS